MLADDLAQTIADLGTATVSVSKRGSLRLSKRRAAIYQAFAGSTKRKNEESFLPPHSFGILGRGIDLVKING